MFSEELFQKKKKSKIISATSQKRFFIEKLTVKSVIGPNKLKLVEKRMKQRTKKYIIFSLQRLGRNEGKNDNYGFYKYPRPTKL